MRPSPELTPIKRPLFHSTTASRHLSSIALAAALSIASAALLAYWPEPHQSTTTEEHTMSQDTVEGRDLYLRHVDTNGKATIRLHRVWNADRFIASQQQEAAKANAEVKGESTPRLARVELSTREAYTEARKARPAR